ncbi:HoxN/HupN/NixA family nickel/cobalt transporter [Campylobacter sp. 7477a]|uniref:HoxN/HupN/NixA family nickel/cobalt transporter n=1 Tax=Campylobacter sp. 7477a TaxID=2735741 RepID=UPI00301436B7|nr:DUF1007 family protein [Campylobacter sp. 7477a]
MMTRILVLILFSINAFGCALCSLYSPTAHVSTKFDTNSTNITGVNFTWSFSENFSELMRQNFDINSDKIIDKKEIREIRLLLLDYLVPRHYLTNVEYYEKDTDAVKFELYLKDYELYFDEGRLKFDLSFKSELPLKEGFVLSVEILDKEEYFHFKFIDSDAYEINDGFWVIPNLNSNIAFYTLSNKHEAKAHNDKPTLKSIVTNQNEHEEIDRIDEEKFNFIAKAGLSYLDRLKELIKNNNETRTSAGLFFMLFCSFVYGFLHAAGAGHGKMLTSSYFAATGGSYTKAAIFSLKIGFMHVLGAFLFVFIMFFSISQISPTYTKDATRLTTIASAIIIIAISLYMIYNKLKFYTKSKNAHDYKFSPHKPGCGCHVCSALTKDDKKSYEEWLISAAVALVPCPGTILVFILAYELGSYLLGFLSGVFMALGMSAVIFIAAVFGATVNKGAFKKLEKFKIYPELIALLFMFSLGLFMLFTSVLQVSVF